MSLSSKIAWRNIWLHKNKSIVIGIILFLGAFLPLFDFALVKPTYL